MFGNEWKKLDSIEFSTFIRLLLLADELKSCNEYTESLWDAEKGRAIFRAMMSLQIFFHTLRVLRFDYRETCLIFQFNPKLFNPSAYVTAGE